MRSVLLAAGYVNVDVVARVDRIPGFGERTTAKSLRRSPGGMTANLACAASRLGLDVRFFGNVGRDSEGSAALAELSRWGVSTEDVVRTERPTTVAIVLLGPDGERSIVSEPMVFDYGPLEETLQTVRGPEERGCLHVDGYRLPEALPILRRARQLGFATSADLDGMDTVSLTQHVTEIALTLDVIFLNRGLAGALAATPKAATDVLFQLGSNVVAVTLGDEGALIACPGGTTCIPAASPDVVRDTTGAGDVFAAAFLASWLEGAGAEEAGEFAVVASGLSVSVAGARGCLPSREEITEIMRSGKRRRAGVEERSGAG